MNSTVGFILAWFWDMCARALSAWLACRNRSGAFLEEQWSTGRLWVLGWKSGMLCPRHFSFRCCSTAAVQLLGKVLFTKEKTILLLLLLKATFTASNGKKTLYRSENSLLAQNLELWLLNTSKNSSQKRTPVLVLASELGKPEVCKSGHCWMAMPAACLFSYSCWNFCGRLSGRNPVLSPAQQTQLNTRSWEITGWQQSVPAGLVCFLTPAAWNQSHPHCSDWFYFWFHFRSLHFLVWWWLISL